MTFDEIVINMQDESRNGNEEEANFYLNVFFERFTTNVFPKWKYKYLSRFPKNKDHIEDIEDVEQELYYKILRKGLLLKYKPEYYDCNDGNGILRYLYRVFSTVAVDYHRKIKGRCISVMTDGTPGETLDEAPCEAPNEAPRELPGDVAEHDQLTAIDAFNMFNDVELTEEIKNHLDMINGLRYNQDVEEKLLAFQLIRVIDTLETTVAPKDYNNIKRLWDIVWKRLVEITEGFEINYRMLFYRLTLPKAYQFNSVMFYRLADKKINPVLKARSSMESLCGRWIRDVNCYIREYIEQADAAFFDSCMLKQSEKIKK